ncbi:uncharacterized protein LOC106155636 [Lingula anatina]|uniref:Uncharacterized protein LOC106155636 n=1 Tax=Lingula anatina TaxID=7574 RepID=A0A1S3HJ14_LINAN|nr:uncharacterized protein LOC106155636 [Lingula anatina]|eukprot:XP_013386007.1 uncharacterized protein LOC106155636 [Lingula anatina]
MGMRAVRRLLKSSIAFQLGLLCFVVALTVVVTCWLMQTPGFRMTTPEVKVVVFEEHHEVLRYWFAEAEAGSFPQSGNTLIHIDGHSDEAPPDYYDEYPFFRWPKTPKELVYMLQKNDVFVVEAVMSGLFNRFVWVWPSWDRQNHSGLYRRTVTEIGWFVPNTDEASTAKVFCQCQPDDTNRRVCFYFNEEVAYLSGGTDVVELDPGRCKVETSYISEEVMDQVFIEKFTKENWIDKSETIILDIDEDYFGCESGADPLLQTKINWKLVELLDTLLSMTFCPMNTDDERVSDLFLTKIIETIMRNCEDSDSQNSFCNSKLKLNATFSQVGKYFNSFFRERSAIFCSQLKSSSRTRVKKIVKLLLVMTYDQLKTLTDIGFCMTTTPKSLSGELYKNVPFQVCHGFNTPNESIVTFHSPTEDEIETRSELMQSIISRLSTPRLISICRSFRDGYVPKKHFRHIENNVLNAVKNAFQEAKLTFHYDPGLLGGQRGWEARHEYRKARSTFQS